MALNRREQQAFESVVVGLCLDDPAWMTRLRTRGQVWLRRVRLARASAAICSFAVLLALSVSGEVGAAAVVAAAGLALTGVVCGIGAAVPAPIPVRARLFRARSWLDRRHRKGDPS